MNELIHYTSNKNWDKIKLEGYLIPFSTPQNLHKNLSSRVRSIVGDNSYIVGIQTPLGGGWFKYGLIGYLLNHTTSEVILKVPILKPDNCFVRDHAHYSPKGTKDIYGVDLFKASLEDKIDYDDKRLLESITRYYESTVRLKEYDGSYNVPEIWLNQITPVYLLTKW